MGWEIHLRKLFSSREYAGSIRQECLQGGHTAATAIAGSKARDLHGHRVERGCNVGFSIVPLRSIGGKSEGSVQARPYCYDREGESQDQGDSEEEGWQLQFYRGQLGLSRLRSNIACFLRAGSRA